MCLGELRRLKISLGLVLVPMLLFGQEGRPPAQQKNPFEAVPGSQTEPPKPEAPKPPNPFETVPQGQEPPQLEVPKPAPTEAPPSTAPGETPAIIQAIEFRGARRVPQDTLRALIFSRVGDRYNEDALRRDFLALWNTGRFDDISMEREADPKGWIIRFIVTERRVVRSIKYEGMKSITVSEVLERFRDRRVGLSVEAQYDPNRVQRAVNVLKDYLSERGRQFATVEPQIRQIPPSSLEITFNVNEGPKVKVGDIDFKGNQVYSDRVLIRAMRGLKPMGIPRSIYLEGLFAKSYDANKLEVDKELVADYYRRNGYFLARTLDHEVSIRDIGGGKFRIPLFYLNRPGKRADISINLEEGRQYHLRNMNFVGVKLFRTPNTLLQPLFEMHQGDVFSTEKLRKGLENMRKLYGEFGYIDFVPEPSFDPQPNGDQIDLTLNVDEGDQFFVRRIDFEGNTTTRDKVIRRELLLDEGQIFNNRYWELSILRLNQLGYFEVLKEDEAADIRRDTRTNTVDITLKVRERGKNSVSMNGGVSGIAGSFIGFGYSTNNFLGLGETLSIDAQLGDRIRSGTFGFTEPYLFDRPIQLGFSVYLSRFNFDQGREVSIATGRNLIPLYESLGRENLQSYITNGYGFSTSVSTPWKRTFARVSLTYSYGVQNITPLSDASKQLFEFSDFQGLAGSNQLEGIKTNALTPSYSYNTVNHPITPTSGKSIFFSSQIAVPGGNVRMIEPTFDYKHFVTGLKPGHVIGWHVLARFVTGYGGRVAPPFNRFYMGGENDIRGFQIWGISPVVFIPSSATVDVVNADGSARMQTVIVNGVKTSVPVTQTIPNYQMLFPGGDTQFVGNFEYRIPIAGPVTLAAFFDAGINRISRPSQLRLNQGRVDVLNGFFPQAGFDAQAIVAESTQKLRTSTGLELQIMMPVVNAPFRVYWAYNPNILQEFIIPPIVADRSYFPNQESYIRSATLLGQARPYFEERKTFRFTVSRTF